MSARWTGTCFRSYSVLGLLVCFFFVHSPRAAAVQPEIATGVVRIDNGHVLLRDCQPWYPKGMSLFGRVVPKGWKTDWSTTQAYLNFGQDTLDEIKWLGGDVVRFQVGMPFLDPQSAQFTPGYVDELRSAVQLARRSGLSVILSMQWQERTNVPPVEKMPGASALRAWGYLGPYFGDDLGVMFELFNEPNSPINPSAADWLQWRAGHQAIIDKLRQLGLRNVLVVEGLTQGKMLSGSPALNDPLNQLAFGIHPRLWTYLNTQAQWDDRFGRFSDQHAVIATEWGHGEALCKSAGPEVVEEFLRYLEKKNIGLIGWGIDMPHTEFMQKEGTGYRLSNYLGKACAAPGAGPAEAMKQLYMRHADPAAHRCLN